MAILDCCPGLKAEIVVGGRPLVEYDDDDKNNNDEDLPPRVLTKYIESPSGAEFAFKWTFSGPLPNRYGVMVSISVDGRNQSNIPHRPNDLIQPGGHVRPGVIFEKDGQRYLQKFRFIALSIVEEVVDSASIQDIWRAVESTGCLSLMFRFIDNVDYFTLPRTESRSKKLPVLGEIPEKALKGDTRSHQATLGEPQKTKSEIRLLRYDMVHEEPFATFHFKYRSRAALKSLRIIDDEPDPAVLESLPEDQLTPGELREVVRRMRQREVENDTIKQENGVERRIKRVRTAVDQNNDDDEVTIIETRSKKRSRVHPEVIVLD